MKYKEFDVLQVLSDTGIILSQGSYSLSEKKIQDFPWLSEEKNIAFSRTWSEISYLFPGLSVILCIKKAIMPPPEAIGSQLAKLFQRVNNKIELNC